MEKNINLAKILNGKPVNTKLWSPLFGDVYTSSICSEDTIIVVNHHAESSSFYNNGKYFNHAEAEPLLFPSKEMRDWSKFAWKKGDILVNKDAEVHIIFDRFENDAYKNFHGQYYLWEEEGSIVSFEEEEAYMQTSDFNKANKEDAQEYIHKIEKELGGKLNLETLKSEKYEFKDGDILSNPSTALPKNHIFIFSKFNKYKDFEYHVALTVSGEITIPMSHDVWCRKDSCVKYATEEEKKQLFSALAKEGKAWDAKKKMIVDLKPKCEFKPFDKVLGRNEKDDVWEAELFSHYKEESQYPFRCIGFSRKYCIPYNEKTAHLLGTTDEWKGGEG